MKIYLVKFCLISLFFTSLFLQGSRQVLSQSMGHSSDVNISDDAYESYRSNEYSYSSSKGSSPDLFGWIVIAGFIFGIGSFIYNSLSESYLALKERSDSAQQFKTNNDDNRATALCCYCNNECGINGVGEYKCPHCGKHFIYEELK